MDATALPPSPFSPAELARWRARLLAERRTAAGDARASAAEAQIDPAQPADVADQEVVRDDCLSLSEAAASVVGEIDAALRRLDLQDPVPFGICERCLVPIEPERLDLMPWTAWCSTGAHRCGA